MKALSRTLMGLVAISGALALVVGCAASGPEAGGETSGGGSGSDVSGTIQWYAGSTEVMNDSAIAAFNEAYPNIKVQVLRATDGELAVRYQQERESGAGTADVVVTSDRAFFEKGTSGGWWDVTAAPAGGFPADGVENGIATVQLQLMQMVFNTDLVTTPPTAWSDLVKPEYEGQIVIPDPRNTTPYLAMLELWRQEFGDEFLQELAAANYRLTPGGVPASEIIAAGGAELLAPAAKSVIGGVLAAGAPIDITPVTPTSAVELYLAITADSPNAEAAKVFYEFLTSKEGQEAYNGDMASSLRTDTDTPALPPADEMVSMKELLPRALENRDEILSLVGIE